MTPTPTALASSRLDEEALDITSYLKRRMRLGSHPLARFREEEAGGGGGARPAAAAPTTRWW